MPLACRHIHFTSHYGTTHGSQWASQRRLCMHASRRTGRVPRWRCAAPPVPDAGATRAPPDHRPNRSAYLGNRAFSPHSSLYNNHRRSPKQSEWQTQSWPGELRSARCETNWLAARGCSPARPGSWVSAPRPRRCGSRVCSSSGAAAACRHAATAATCRQSAGHQRGPRFPLRL